MALETAIAATKLFGGLKSLFGKKPSAREQSRDALMGQAQGAREAADKYGFNPLTLLGVSSGIGSNAAADTPLASIEMITGAMQDIADVYTSRDAHGQARLRFDREMTGIEMDRARSGHSTVLTRPILAAGSMPGGDTFGGGHQVRTDAAGNPLADLVMNGEVVEANDRWSNTDVIEQRYGDVFGAAYGLGVATSDYAKNRGHTPVADAPPMPTFGETLAKITGAKPVEDMPLQERPYRWMVREWGSIPDGWENGGIPYWHPNGDKSRFSYRAPNGKAVW